MVAIVEEGMPRGSRHWAVGEARPGGVEGDSVYECVGKSSVKLSAEDWVVVATGIADVISVICGDDDGVGEG